MKSLIDKTKRLAERKIKLDTKVSRESKRMKLVDGIKLLVLGLTILGGLLFGISDFFDKPVIDRTKIPAFTLTLVGGIAIELILEVYVSIKKLDERLNLHDMIAEMSNDSRAEFIESISDYIILHKLRKRARIGNDGNPAFSEIAGDILKDQDAQLELLAKGRLWVPENQIASIQRLLVLKYRKRFDAVSDQDLSFWSQSHVVEEYLETNRDIITSGGKVSRIFIFTLEDFSERRDQILEVLARQHKSHIAWAAIVKEEIRTQLENGIREGVVPDFALFDGGKALSFFKSKDYPRNFEAIFDLNTLDGGVNKAFIAKQKSFHQMLINKCWLVNESFDQMFGEAAQPQTASSGQQKVFKDILAGKIDVKAEEEFDPGRFVLVVNSAEEIKGKVEKLSEWTRKWRG